MCRNIMGLFTAEVSDKGLISDIKNVPYNKLGTISIPLTQKQAYYRLLKQTGQFTTIPSLLPEEIAQVDKLPEFEAERKKSKEEKLAKMIPKIITDYYKSTDQTEPDFLRKVDDELPPPPLPPSGLLVTKEDKKKAKKIRKQKTKLEKLIRQNQKDDKLRYLPEFAGEPITAKTRIDGTGFLGDMAKSLAGKALSFAGEKFGEWIGRKMKPKTMLDKMKEEWEATTDPDERKKLEKKIGYMSMAKNIDS